MPPYAMAATGHAPRRRGRAGFAGRAGGAGLAASGCAACRGAGSAPWCAACRAAGRGAERRCTTCLAAGCWVLGAGCWGSVKQPAEPQRGTSGAPACGRVGGLPVCRPAEGHLGRAAGRGTPGTWAEGQPVSRSAATPPKAVGSAPASRPASRRSLRRTRTPRHARGGPRPVPQPHERRARHRTDPARTQHTHLPHR